MLLLSIDTSTKACSVALHSDGQLAASYELFVEKTHSSWLTTLIEQVFLHTGRAISEVDAIAVAKGPGSYTGLRIGVSTAKGLCFGLNKPLIGINTLTAMAAQLQGIFPKEYALCPMLDARRMEVYTAVYDSQTLAPLLPTSAVVIQNDSFVEILAKRPLVFFGEGAAKCMSLLSHHQNAHFYPAPVWPSAKTVGQLAGEAFRLEQFEDLHSFEPFYLKEFRMTTSTTLL